MSKITTKEFYGATTTNKDRKLILQNMAMEGYYEHSAETFDHVESEKELPSGDTLALFVWREINDAEGNIDEAIKFMHSASRELSSVAAHLKECQHSGQFTKTKT